ncbi:FOG: CheY-like receiver [Moorella thermoacetica Y72]|uniref:FOG: CheY-like receiver n=1 Tax=Moorella thermoacetica Y72 TaxID=1325331 RepID=A0A0S6UGA5_NEOTH|nr:FOG: CheY-like receiver [Moorella thermoacetica Y72]
MHLGRQGDLPAEIWQAAKAPGQLPGKAAHPDDMITRIVVIGLGGPGQGLDGIVKGLLRIPDLPGHQLQEAAIGQQILQDIPLIGRDPHWVIKGSYQQGPLIKAGIIANSADVARQLRLKKLITSSYPAIQTSFSWIS